MSRFRLQKRKQKNIKLLNSCKVEWTKLFPYFAARVKVVPFALKPLIASVRDQFAEKSVVTKMFLNEHPPGFAIVVSKIFERNLQKLCMPKCYWAVITFSIKPYRFPLKHIHSWCVCLRVIFWQTFINPVKQLLVIFFFPLFVWRNIVYRTKLIINLYFWTACYQLFLQRRN